MLYQNKYIEAREHIDLALKLNPISLYLILKSAWLYSEVGNYEKALESLDKKKKYESEISDQEENKIIRDINTKYETISYLEYNREIILEKLVKVFGTSTSRNFNNKIEKNNKYEKYTGWTYFVKSLKEIKFKFPIIIALIIEVINIPKPKKKAEIGKKIKYLSFLTVEA